jgi:hypothetical protein
MGGEPQPSRAAVIGTGVRSRPTWVWVITLYCFAGFGFTLLWFALVLFGAVPMSPEQRAYFTRLGPLEYGLSLGIAAVNLAGNILLFRLKKSAVPLLAANLALSLGFIPVHAATTNWSAAVGRPGWVGTFIGWAMLAGVVLYARHLRRAGVLR